MIKKITMKFDKFFRLVKKAIHFAWHRHHFLIPPKAMKKYIKSFFVVLKRGGGTSNLFTNQKTFQWIYIKSEHPEITQQNTYLLVSADNSIIYHKPQGI